MTALLNSFWTAISTPNELLINIISVPLTFLIEVPLTLYLICSIFNINCSKKQKLIYVLLTASISVIAKYFIKFPFNIIINYLCAFGVIYLIFRMNIIKTILAGVLPSIIFMLLESLILNPFLFIFNISYSNFETIAIYRISLAFFVYFIVFLFSFFLKNKDFTINILDTFDKKNKIMIISTFVFGLISIIMQLLLTVNFIDLLPVHFSLFNFICLLLYFCLSFFSLTRIIKLVSTTEKLESAEAYNNTLHILHDSVRGFKHDFDNIVTTIGGYVKTNDTEGLKTYYYQLEEDCQKVNNLYILNPDIINNPGIYNLLTTKYNEAIQKNIKFNMTFLLDLNDLHMKVYEFARILGILLDNAIEAASECDNKIINIIFRKDDTNNRNLIIIENSYKDKDVDINSIFNKGVSNKENHTGLGLWEIRQILNKNNNLNLHTSKTEDLFIQQFEIYY